MNRFPTDHEPDDGQVDPELLSAALERVRAADPAVDAVLDADSLHETLAVTTGVQVGTAPGDELAAARARRRTPRWFQVAAVVAGIAVVGASGYAIGAKGADASATSADASLEAPMSLGGAAPAEQQEVDSGAAVDAQNLVGGRDALPSSYWYGGRTVFHGAGLPTAGSSHDAWGFDPSATYSQATAALAADVFGVSGKPRQDAGGWTVGKQDGSVPTVTIAPDGTTSVSYYDPTRDPWACGSDVVAPPDEPDSSTADDAKADDTPGDDGAVSGGSEPDFGVDGDCTAEAPSAKDATATARDALADLGLDPDDYAWTTQTDAGASVNVGAELVVDGQRTGLTWWFTVMSDGVQSAWGSLAPVVALGSYDVVSPAQAVERLNDPRFGASGGGVYPMAAREALMGAMESGTDTSSNEEPTSTPTPPAAPEPGASFSWPVMDVTITAARLGVALQTDVDGSTSLIPTYELTSDDGSTWTVVAVADSMLDLTS
ncbi:hypothetical protein [Cellulomonas composti]|uniref:Uncharacterized protein n=1 Tax=Cellulomonas composti TaxID=266130 RepID=A0A511JC57_9CELL|nr:hypothetical protein [Cellulomonas composti]GEL95283.1 hypothetical protein CCO02nite_19410 [Cellulomonas composti]